MARIFISHSSRDNAEAIAVRLWLMSQGWNDLFLDVDPVDGLVATQRWQKALRDSIARCRAVIFCLSEDWCSSKYCIAEFWCALEAGAAPIGVIVKPVDRKKIPAEMTGEWQLIDLTLGGTPRRFPVAPPPERREAVVSFPTEELQRLREGLGKLGLVGFNTESFSWPPPGDKERAPYRGMRPLDGEDAGVFFGRDADLVRARETMLVQRGQGGRRLVVILGASGAGKSSFLRAGLLPRLSREDRDFFVLPIIRPAGTPVLGPTGLAQSLWEALKQLDAERPLGDLKALLERDPGAVPALLGELQMRASSRLIGEGKAQVERSPTLIIAIDQAEELYDSGAEAQRFLNHLAAALSPGLETIAILTIRSDRFEPLQGLAKLSDIPKEPFNLPPVTPFDFREAIVGPARRPDPRIEVAPDLVEALIADMAAQGADPLPLLAFTLERLYINYGRSNKAMTLANYVSLGGIKGSLADALSKAFANPDTSPSIPADATKQEDLLEAIFVPALVSISESNDQPLRRIADLSEITTDGRRMVDRLIEARLLVQSAVGTRTTIEVAHEALLRQWDTLQRILDRRRSELKALQAVERAAHAWDAKNRAPDWLDHKGQRLAEAEQLAGRSDLALRLRGLPNEYLSTCRQVEDRARRHQQRLRVWAQVATSGALLVATLMLVGSILLDRQTQRREAYLMTAVADRAIGEGQYERAMRAALESLPAAFGWPLLTLDWSGREMRGLEAKLAGAAQGTPFRLRLAGHSGEVRSVRFSSDGKLVATGSDDGTARVWDAATGTELYRLAGHAGEVRCADFSPDRTRIVTASKDGTARVWDAANHAVLLELKGHTDELFCAAFSSDGALIVTASKDKTAVIWDAKTGARLRSLAGHDDTVTSATFSPDGALIVTGSQDATARIWNVASGAETATFRGHISGVRNAAFSPNGERIVTASWDQTVRVWDARTSAELFRITDHHKAVRSAAFSPDGTRIVTASDDHTARLWDARARGPTLLQLNGHSRPVVSASFGPDGKRVVTGSEDMTARIWDVTGTPETLRIRVTDKSALGATFSPDGTRIVTASAAPVAQVWDAASGESLLPLTGHSGVVRSAVFSPDGTLIGTASDDRTTRLWNAQTGAQIKQIAGHTEAVRSVAFSPDGARIVTASADQTARVWDVRSAAPILVLKGHRMALQSAAFSRDGTRIVTASDDKTVRVWDARTGAELFQLKPHSDATWSAAFNRDGTRIVTASWDHTARVSDATSREILVEFTDHTGLLHAAVFSPDGERVASASWDRSVRIWDAETGVELIRLDGHTGPVRSVDFSPDGARLVTTSEDGTARVWDVRWLATLHRGDLARRTCAERLVGDAQFFAPEDIGADRTLSGLAGQNPCLRHQWPAMLAALRARSAFAEFIGESLLRALDARRVRALIGSSP